MHLATRALVLLTALPFTARALPVAVAHTGYVLAANDAPLDTGAGTLPFEFDLFAASNQAGGATWQSGACALPVRAGYYATTLGATCGSGLDAAALTTTRWLRVTVNGVSLTPLVRLDPVPSASSAAEATLAFDLNCTGCVAASETTGLVALSPSGAQAGNVNVTGSVTAGSFAGNGAALTNLATTNLTGTISDAQIAAVATTKLTGTVSDAQIAAVATTKLTGTITDAQIAAVATTKLTGNISDAQIAAVATTKLTGTVSDAQLASGSDLDKLSATQTITGTKTFAPASGSAPFAVGAGKTGVVTNLNADLFDGVHLFSLPFACPAGQAVTGFTNSGGTVTPVCATFAGGGTTLGTAGNPAIDCRAIKLADSNASSGLYWLDPDGGGAIASQQAWCEMTGDGKGWTLCAALGHQKFGDGFTYLNTSWQTSNRVFWTGAAVGGYGQFCNELTINEIYAKALSSTTAVTFSTLQVSTGGVNPFATNAKNSFSNGASRVAVWVKGSLALNYFGQGAGCSDFNNGQTQGSNLCISDGTNWQTMQGNINGGTVNKDWMCAPNTSCGNSTTHIVLFYAR